MEKGKKKMENEKRRGTEDAEKEKENVHVWVD